jgi:AraC-like DNA-binding protein
MILKYFDTDKLNPLVEELFHIRFTKDDLPFQSTIIPICCTSITYIFKPGQSSLFKGKQIPLENLTVTGQFLESYQFIADEESYSYGVCFHPTTLHKLTQLNIYKIKNKHIPLKDFDSNLFDLLNPVFIENKDNISQLNKSIKAAILKMHIKTNDTIKQIDKLIEMIRQKEGMLNTYELLDKVNFTQKTLETQFKKIVGLTPGKYIRSYRFVKLMRKYEGKEIRLKDLIFMYNYYDQSHFTKDFKYFMKQTPKEYFKTDHPFINEYLNK